MKILYGVVVIAAALTFRPAQGGAQQSSPVLFAHNEQSSLEPATRPAFQFTSSALQEPPSDKPEDQMSMSGFFLGAVGMLAGAAIGSQIGQNDCPDRTVDKRCVMRHAYTGALVAGSALVPVGVHLASPTRGNLLFSLAASAVEGAALYYGFKAVPGSPIAMAPFLAAPLQIVTSVKIEQRRTK